MTDADVIRALRARGWHVYRILSSAELQWAATRGDSAGVAATSFDHLARKMLR
jgi:hypothetical protein